jgi:RimJ/RimL family protein N-acetyltransferase/nicotinamidase-related amidase
MVLLVIDTQKGIMDDRLYGFEGLKDNIKTLIKASRERDVEVIYVRHDDGPGSGFSKGDADFEIYEEFAPAEGEKIFDKNVNSAFHDSTGLAMYLESKNISSVIAVGLQTDYCMDATIKSGFEKGYKMIVPEYTNSTRSNTFMDAKSTYDFYNRNMWPGRYARCLSLEETLKLIKEYKKSENPVRIAGCGTKEIETQRLILRPFSMEDAKSVLDNWAGDEKVQKMYGEPAYKTVEEVKSLLQKYIAGYVTGYTYRWAVIEKESGECIGQIAFFLVDKFNSWGEIEYAIGKAYQGKGYATEAAKAVIDYGFKEIGFNKVQICVRPSNVKSKNVIEKCGFEYEGMLRDYFFIDGEYEGRMYYSLLSHC